MNNSNNISINNKFNTIEDAIEAFKNGKIIIISDNENRENEGDVVIAAEHITKEAMNFIIKKASGLVCVAITSDIAKRINLNQMVNDESNTDHLKTAFTVSIDSKYNITTGISSQDRVNTIKLIANNKSMENDFVKPGHVFPLVARDRGLYERRGHTEASVLMAKLANCKSHASVICEIIDDNGDMVRGEALFKYAKEYKFPIISVDMLYEYISKTVTN